jgi:AcrR family transcriptional regulator
MARTAGSHGPTTLEAIRQEGLRLIYEHGYEAMSLRQLAAEVGIQVGSLYNHIRNKQDFLFDLMRMHHDDLLSAWDGVLQGVDDPVEQMKAFVAFHVAYHIDRRRDVYVANFELRSLEPQNYAAIVEKRRRYERDVIGIVERGVKAGVFAVSDPQAASYGILSMLTGVCTWFRPDGRLRTEEVTELYTSMVLKSLAPSPTKTPLPDPVALSHSLGS